MIKAWNSLSRWACKQFGVTSMSGERGAGEKAGGVDKGQVVVGPGVFQSFLPTFTNLIPSHTVTVQS